HFPALDGLRGIAVIGVLLFHGGFNWAQGGFLGVSTFFVLSGFLITNLLLREWQDKKTLHILNFWSRRFRRLLPPSLLTLLLVALIWRFVESSRGEPLLGSDLIAALAYFANWQFYLEGNSYASLFAAPSPVLHYWSLAIEEQFYLVFPLFMLGVLRVGGSALLSASLICYTTISVVLILLLQPSLDRVYYGTDTRVAEILVGSMLSIWCSHSRQLGEQSTQRAFTSTFTTVLGLSALAFTLACWIGIPKESPLIAQGGLVVYALASAAIIYACIKPGIVSYLLSRPLLRGIGLISYGIYLYHWPIFLLLDQQQTGMGQGLLFLIQVTLTVIIAVLSYFLLERPIRERRLLASNTHAAAATTILAGVITLTTLKSYPWQSNVPFADVDLNDFEGVLLGSLEESNQVPDTGSDQPSTLLILGDSGAVDATPALTAVFEAAGFTSVIRGAFPGIGLSNPAFDWSTHYRKIIETSDPDLVVMMLGDWDRDFYQSNGQDAYTDLVEEVATLLTARGAKLLWLSMLPGGNNPERPPEFSFKELPARLPGQVFFADVSSSLRAPPGASAIQALPGSESWPRAYIDEMGDRIILRKPDFWHLCPEGAERLATAIHHAAVILGLAAPATDEWRLGSWRESPRYDDPPAACTPDEPVRIQIDSESLEE
ncbi:MAG: acyltransferase family protein, partial [Pseudomonadota bacterium]